MVTWVPGSHFFVKMLAGCTPVAPGKLRVWHLAIYSRAFVQFSVFIQHTCWTTESGQRRYVYITSDRLLGVDALLTLLVAQAHPRAAPDSALRVVNGYSGAKVFSAFQLLVMNGHGTPI